MTISTALVGRTTQSVVHEVDQRWTMAYAAGLGDVDDCYLDTARPGGVVAHPLFAVAVEWPSVMASGSLAVDTGTPVHELFTAIHADHDVTVHRLIRPGDVLTTTAEVVDVRAATPGVVVTLRVVTVDSAGAPVATTTQRSIYLGVEVDGESGRDREQSPQRTPPSGAIIVEEVVSLDGGAAHVYTECSRIWNPIHTDRAVAQTVGLPGIIMHGTATLARAVSAIVARYAGGRPDLVRRIACRFAAMVELPSEVTIRMWSDGRGDEAEVVGFEVLNASGSVAIKHGVIQLGEPPADA